MFFNNLDRTYTSDCVESNPFEQQNNNSNELSPQTSVAAPSERSYQTVVLKGGRFSLSPRLELKRSRRPTRSRLEDVLNLFYCFSVCLRNEDHHRGSYARSSTNKPAGSRRQEEKGNGHNCSKGLHPALERNTRVTCCCCCCCCPSKAATEHPTTHHIASYMYALKTSSTDTLQPAL